MKSKKRMAIYIIFIVFCIFAVVLTVFSLQATIIRGIGEYDMGSDLPPDIDPWNLPILGFQKYAASGIIPLVSPLVLLCILSMEDKRTREVLLLALLLITLVCYTHSINAAWDFLEVTCSVKQPTGRFSTGMIYPVAYTVFTLLAFAFQEYLPAEGKEV